MISHWQGAGERLWNCGQFQSRIELLCLPRPPHMPTFVRLDTAGASPQSGAAEVLVYTKPHGVRVQNSVIDEVFASTWQDIYIQQRELIKIEDAGPAVRQRAERDLQVALDVITSLGLSPVEEMEEAAND